MTGTRWTRSEGAHADVVLYTVAGGGHTWPGGHPLPAFITGPTTDDIDATRVIWEFFRKHPLLAEDTRFELQHPTNWVA